MWRLEMSTKKQKVRTALDMLRLFNEKADELRASPYVILSNFPTKSGLFTLTTRWVKKSL